LVGGSMCVNVSISGWKGFGNLVNVTKSSYI